MSDEIKELLGQSLHDYLVEYGDADWHDARNIDDLVDATIIPIISNMLEENRQLKDVIHASNILGEIKRLLEESKARKIALDFAKGAIEDAIYTEDGLDGQAGQAVIDVIDEAILNGTFDKGL